MPRCPWHRPSRFQAGPGACSTPPPGSGRAWGPKAAGWGRALASNLVGGAGGGASLQKKSAPYKRVYNDLQCCEFC